MPLLGPLYHLIEREDWLTALREAARVVRPGGVVLAGAVSRFASLFDSLVRGSITDPVFRPVLVRTLRDGRHATSRRRRPADRCRRAPWDCQTGPAARRAARESGDPASAEQSLREAERLHRAVGNVTGVVYDVGD